MHKTVIVLAAVLSVAPAAAQESPNYSLSDYSFGSGAEFALESPAYRMTLVTTGEPAAGEELSSESYAAGGGFAVCYPPPGETSELRFVDPVSLVWAWQPGADVYNVYRELLTSLGSPTYGACLVAGVASASTNDPDPPPSGDGFFYLVTAENLLAEEGPLGTDSSGAWRPNLHPCN